MLHGKFISAAALAVLCHGAFADTDAQWRFRVWLDDREIGFHEFLLEGEGQQQQLISRAEFEYRLLFVKLYEYRHLNRETWKGGCLTSIDSETDANGEPFSVTGRRQGETFRITGASGEAELPGCVMTFAYWNPAFLSQKRLVNSQNGEFLEVSVSPGSVDRLLIGGREVPATRYRVEAKDMDLLLWYSEQNDWLALEAETDGGRTLRYERQL